MRKTLETGFDRPVGLGGTFIQKAGTVKYHVMPDFSCALLNTDKDVENWLTFHEFGAPFVNMATLGNSPDFAPKSPEIPLISQVLPDSPKNP